jgi:hypothetical protein
LDARREIRLATHTVDAGFVALVERYLWRHVLC